MNKPQLYEEYKKINRLLSTAQERQRMLELFNNIQGTENTRMRNEIKELKVIKASYDDLKLDYLKLENDVEELKEEIEELKEKNKIEEYHIENELQPENIKLKKEIEELKEENKKLKRDIDGDGMLYEGYKKELSNQNKQINRWCKDNVKLKKEIEELKLSRTGQAQEHYALSKSYDKLKEQIEELKKENKELEQELRGEECITNQLDNFNEASGKDFSDIEELYTAYMDSDKMIKTQDEHIIGLETWIEELEEKIESMKCSWGGDK